jgi:hypothetical protein
MNKKVIILISLLSWWMAVAALLSSYHPPDRILLKQRRLAYEQKELQLENAREDLRKLEEARKQFPNNPYFKAEEEMNDVAKLKRETDTLEREVNELSKVTWRLRLIGTDEDLTQFLALTIPAIFICVPLFFWFRK